MGPELVCESFPSSVPIASTTVHGFLAKQLATNQAIQRFVMDSATIRAQMVAKFADLQQTVGSIARHALASFDADVRLAVKRMEIDAESAEVLAQQLAASLVFLHRNSQDSTTSTSSLEAPVTSPTINVAVCDDVVTAVLKECWRVATADDGDVDTSALATARLRKEIHQAVRSFPCSSWLYVCLAFIGLTLVCRHRRPKPCLIACSGIVRPPRR